MKEMLLEGRLKEITYNKSKDNAADLLANYNKEMQGSIIPSQEDNIRIL